jgi:hypothetical protein
LNLCRYTAGELERWRSAFLYFCKKIQLVAGGAHKQGCCITPGCHPIVFYMDHTGFHQLNRVLTTAK